MTKVAIQSAQTIKGTKAGETLLLHWKNSLGIVIGAAIYAFGIHYFVISNEFMEGGITGVTLLLHYAFGFPPSLLNLAINIPLFIISWRTLGRQQLAYTLLGTFALSLFLWIMEIGIRTEWITPFRWTQDYLLAALYAGVCLGTGIGIVLRSGGTTGGTDIIARIFQLYKGWSMGKIILVIDVIVIGTSLIYIPMDKILYTLVAVFVASKVIDFITDGAYAARSFTIVTERGDEVADVITQQLERGVTLLPAHGAYSGKSKQIVYCVVSRGEMRALQSLVKKVDPFSFIVISDVHDVLGEGFRIR